MGTTPKAAKTRKRIMRIQPCSVCGEEILTVMRTKTARCEECFTAYLNVYRRGFKDEIIEPTAIIGGKNNNSI